MAFDIFGGLFKGGFGGLAKSFGSIMWILLIAIPIVLVLGVFFYWLYKRKVWNLDVEIKIPRSDGKLVNAEWGKASYNAKRGVVFIKRKKKKKVPMKPFNVNKYLQGDRILTVVQVGATEYRPVLNESWMDMENDQPMVDKDGKLKLDEEGNPIHEEGALLNMRVDNSESKAWRNSWERDAKSTYSIMSLLHEYAVPISIGLIIVLWGIQFVILYTRIK